MSKGIFITQKKDGTTYYRVSINYRNKHISLGSSSSYEEADTIYQWAFAILRKNQYKISDYLSLNPLLSFEKWVILINFRDKGLYFKTPIYLSKSYFTYYLDPNTELLFDVDDLFFYSSHKIFRRGNYFFVNDFGMQMNILSRFGIRNYAKDGKDYLFIDGNSHNMRYENIQIVNPYNGVELCKKNNETLYRAKIHILGYINIGYFQSPHKAAIAYNKAVDFVKRYLYPDRNYTKNYVDAISQDEIDFYYTSIKLPNYLIQLVDLPHQ
ncbi:MAG: hypothetical protein JW708_06320 [Vallitaleaceae bacterium]|nr:hypothetical protein [Vallitaleaceae bacterium]